MAIRQNTGSKKFWGGRRELRTLHGAGGNGKWCNGFGQQSGSSAKE